MNIIGIDAGNGNFKIAKPDPTGNPVVITTPMGETVIPAAVFFQADGTILIGAEAINAGFVEPERLVRNWKRSMGTVKVLYQAKNGTAYLAKDILTLLLQKIKEIVEGKTGQVMQDVVITVPACYSEHQKQQTLEAAQAAGLTVLLTPHEPTAAGLGNDLYKRKQCTAVVYDLGSSTFDISVIKCNHGVFDILATGGSPKIGGQDFSDRINKLVLNEFQDKHGFRPDDPIVLQELNQRIEQLKISLAVQSQSQIILSCKGQQFQKVVARKLFDDLVGDLVDQTIIIMEQTLQEAHLGYADIDEIYLVGGGSTPPIIREKVERASGKKVTAHCEPLTAAACGAVIAGRIECERQGKPFVCGNIALPGLGISLRDILSHSVGVLVLDERENEICHEILAKDTSIPSRQLKTFKLADPCQTEAKIQILQGSHGQPAADCLSLGCFELTGLPSRPDLIGRIEITFDLDANGMLSATARDVASGKTAALDVEYTADITSAVAI